MFQFKHNSKKYQCTTLFINCSSINTYGNKERNRSQKASDEDVLLKLAQMLDNFICLIFARCEAFRAGKGKAVPVLT
jgi:hypothetical protein